jgi:hypothetical protein
MGSKADTNSTEPSDNDRLLEALTMREVRRGLINSDLDVDEDASREEVGELLSSHTDTDQLRQDIITGAKERLLEDTHVKTDHIEGTGQDTVVIRDNLNLREAHYYSSFFQYADHASRTYKIEELGGVLAEIAESSNSASETEEMLRNHINDGDFDVAYAQALEEIPASIIGDLDETYRPRLVEAEDESTLHIEYWKPGKTWSTFDVETGDYEKIHTLYRAVVRVHLDSGLVETSGDSSGRSNEALVRRFLNEFNDSDSMSRIHIRGEHIREAKANLGLLTSLNEFVGEEAKVRLTRNQANNVEADPANEQMESERDYARSNFQMFIGENDGDWDLIYRVDLGEDIAEEDDVNAGEVLKALEPDYDNVLPITLSLNSENSTFRIQKKSIDRSTRNQVFDLLAEQLGWSS